MTRIELFYADVPVEFHACVKEVSERRGRLLIGCVQCTEAFTARNVFTEAGWRETQISGMCEKCWDTLFAEPDEGPIDVEDLEYTPGLKSEKDDA